MATLKINKNSITNHLVFWVVLIVVLSFFGQDTFFRNLTGETIIVLFYAVIVYFNIYYLFPKYVKDNNLIIHLVYLLLTSAVLAPIKTFTLYKIYNNTEIRQSLVNDQYFIFLSSFLVGVASTIYSILIDWMKGMKEKQELANQTLQSELKFLKSQINPHFLFNTLNSLYALTLKKSDLAPEIVLKLSEMMRYMLYECNEKIVPLEKEVNYMINYLELEKLRHGKKMELHLDIEGDTQGKYIAPLIFIPFIENCFKHGMNHQIKQGFVDIKLTINKEDLNVRIENSKTSHLPGKSLKKSGGIGLANVKRRLNLLYPAQHQLTIADNPETYIVNLNLHLNE